jgi:hypothetical protein
VTAAILALIDAGLTPEDARARVEAVPLEGDVDAYMAALAGVVIPVLENRIAQLQAERNAIDADTAQRNHTFKLSWHLELFKRLETGDKVH